MFKRKPTLVSFAMQKLYSLMLYYLFIFVFVACCFWCHIQESIAKANVTRLFLYVFFWEFYSFRILCLSLYFILSRFLFMVQVRVNFHTSACGIQFSQHLLLKRLFFPHCILLAPFWCILDAQ